MGRREGRTRRRRVRKGEERIVLSTEALRGKGRLRKVF